MENNNKNSPRIKRQRLNAEDRRQQLLDCAISVTARNGLGHTKHADIAEMAGVAVSTVFFYFPTVEILNNTIIDAIEAKLDSITWPDIKIETNRTPLNSMFDATFDHIEKLLAENRDYLVIFLEWGSAINNVMWSRYLAYRNRHTEFVKAALKKGVERGEVKENIDLDDNALVVIVFFRMFIKLKCLDEKESIIRELYQCMRNHLLINP